jgi:hypothetical protein
LTRITHEEDMMRREEFRPRAYEKNRLSVGLSTRLLETPVCLDEEPVDPDKPAPPPQVPPKPQDPLPDPGQPDPKAAPDRARVPSKPRKR